MWLFRVPVRGMLAVSKCQALCQALYVPRLIYPRPPLPWEGALPCPWFSIIEWEGRSTESHGVGGSAGI